MQTASPKGACEVWDPPGTRAFKQFPMAWLPNERRALRMVEVEEVPEAHVAALSAHARLGAECRWFDVVHETRRDSKARGVRLGLPISVITPRVLGQCAMALHMLSVPYGTLHPSPGIDLFLENAAHARVTTCISLATDRAVPGLAGSIGGGSRVHLLHETEEKEMCPFLADLSCAETRLHDARGLVRLYHDASGTRAVSVSVWRTRALLLGLSRFLLSAKRHAARTPEADALLDQWAHVVTQLTRLSVAQLAGERSPLSETEWADLAKRIDPHAKQPAVGALFHGTLAEHVSALDGAKAGPPDGRRLMLLGWCAVALSSGAFAYTSQPPKEARLLTINSH